jgi:hypothetical protein
MSTTPAAWPGAFTEMCESSVTEIAVPATPPKVTLVAPLNRYPDRVLAVPPAVAPVAGAMAPMVTRPAAADRSATVASGAVTLGAQFGAPVPTGAHSV